eukprot:6820393-Pyramimonas_sp.AAC.1
MGLRLPWKASTCALAACCLVPCGRVGMYVMSLLFALWVFFQMPSQNSLICWISLGVAAAFWSRTSVLLLVVTAS